ncbi:TPA: hypothetical protein QDB28_005090 [Burkholderia vietnamiensis]|nr:hypothetical protein [Burkholderia vietnamiensis]
MKEPILSREEVEAIAHRICVRYFHSENIHLRQYTFGITTLEQLVDAILEKLCGEPVAWMVLECVHPKMIDMIFKLDDERRAKEKHHG